MKRKPYLYFSALMLCGALMSGCAKTPEQSVVREKGSQSIANYKEATEAETESGNAETEKEEAAVEQETAEAEGSGLNELARRLQVPERYKASGASADEQFSLTCDAEVVVPDVDKVSVYQVSRLPLDQELIDRTASAFFGDAAIYDGNSYFNYTKDQALARLNELKAYQAEGNTDPYGIIAGLEEAGNTDINPEDIYSLQGDIDSWEQIYAEAPETAEKVEPARPYSVVTDGSMFVGAAELTDGTVYSYKVKSSSPFYIDIAINRWLPEYGQDIQNMWPAFHEDNSDPGYPSREKAEEMAGITAEEAVRMADEYIEKLGLTDFSAKSAQLSLMYRIDGQSFFTNETVYSDGGYMVTYTRDVNGFPITCEGDYGGNLESMESTIEAWGYEYVEICVNKEGLQYAEILNLYQLGEQQLENVELLSFPEVADIFEKMIQIQHTDITYLEHTDLLIDRVTLGYMRIYDPGADNTSGLLVPVWDFFGTETDKYDAGTTYVTDDPLRSLMTVNAVDGTIINRSLGY